jgi:hypothetical protein
MPQIPGSRFIDRQASTATPTESPVFVNANALTAPAVAAQNFGVAGMGLGVSLLEADTVIRNHENAIVSQDAANKFHERARLYTEDKRQLVGANAIGLSRVAATDIGQDYTQTRDALPNDAAKQLFDAHAFSTKETFLTAVASHELTQLAQYRTDTINASFQNAAEDIKLSTGDPKIVADVVSKYEQQLTALYPGQDVSGMKQQHRALLEKAGLEAQNRYAETAAFQVVRNKFTTVGADGTPNMDYVKAKNFLIDNPDNLPEITRLTIQQRTQLADIIYADGQREKVQKKEEQAQVAGTMFNSYDKLLRGLPMSPDEPQTFAEFHSRMNQYVANGQVEPETARVAIQFTQQEEVRSEKILKETTAADVWGMYDRILMGSPTGAGEPSTFPEWHARVEQLVREGKLDDSVLKTAITFTKQEQLQDKASKDALALESRREQAAARQRRMDLQAEADRARRTDPLMQSNLQVLSTIKSKILADPTSVPVSDLIGMVGKGLSIADAQDLVKIAREAPGKAWGSPTGIAVKTQLNTFWKNYGFSTDDVKNNSGYNDALTHFQQWIQKYPNATPEEADKEIRRYMYPLRRGWFMQQYDAIRGNAPILSKD